MINDELRARRECQVFFQGAKLEAKTWLRIGGLDMSELGAIDK